MHNVVYLLDLHVVGLRHLDAFHDLKACSSFYAFGENPRSDEQPNGPYRRTWTYHLTVGLVLDGILEQAVPESVSDGGS